MKTQRIVEVVSSITYNELHFLQNAVSDDETRYYMCAIRIEASKKEGKLRGLATDGKHAHIVDPLSAGIENIMGDEKEGYLFLASKPARNKFAIVNIIDSRDMGVFPNVDKVFPDGEAQSKVEFKGIALSKKSMVHDSLYIAELYRIVPAPHSINLAHLLALGDIETWSARWYGLNNSLTNTEPMVFTCDNKTAIMAPLKPS